MKKALFLTIGIALFIWSLSLANAESDTKKEIRKLGWTFDQAENVACFTLREIIEKKASVLLVVHDAEDHDWQFLSGAAMSMDDAIFVSMRDMVDLDPTLLEVGHIPPGYQATRQSVGSKWKIEASDE